MLQCVLGQFGRAMNAQLDHDAGLVELSGLYRNIEVFRDFLGRASLEIPELKYTFPLIVSCIAAINSETAESFRRYAEAPARNSSRINSTWECMLIEDLPAVANHRQDL